MEGVSRLGKRPCLRASAFPSLDSPIRVMGARSKSTQQCCTEQSRCLTQGRWRLGDGCSQRGTGRGGGRSPSLSTHHSPRIDPRASPGTPPRRRALGQVRLLQTWPNEREQWVSGPWDPERGREPPCAAPPSPPPPCRNTHTLHPLCRGGSAGPFFPERDGGSAREPLVRGAWTPASEGLARGVWEAVGRRPPCPGAGAGGSGPSLPLAPRPPAAARARERRLPALSRQGPRGAGGGHSPRAPAGQQQQQQQRRQKAEEHGPGHGAAGDQACGGRARETAGRLGGGRAHPGASPRPAPSLPPARPV